jgi:hypothetical protein
MTADQDEQFAEDKEAQAFLTQHKNSSPARNSKRV